MLDRLAQFRLDLDSCCGKQPKGKRWLTGIEKHVDEPVDLIEDEYKREFSDPYRDRDDRLREQMERESELNRGDRQ